MDDSLPGALVHLREAEIVRLCGLARAARGQEYARQGRVRQAERAAGTLRAAVLDGETSRAAMARFSENGLEAWQCDCSQAPEPSDQPLASPGIHPPCEHLAALLTLWVREPERFRAAPAAAAASAEAEVVAPSANLETGGKAPEASPVSAVPVEFVPPRSATAPEPVVVPEVTLASLEHLGPHLRRVLNLIALTGGSITEQEARRLFTRLELGEPEEAVAALDRLQQAGFVQPVYAPAVPSKHAAAASIAGWSIPAALLERLPCVVPLAPLSMPAETQAQREQTAPETETLPSEEQQEALAPEEGLHAERATLALPVLLVQVVALMVDRTAPPSLPDLPQPAAARATLDLDAALAQQWASQLKSTPEQVRFCLALLRLLGMLPQTAPVQAAVRLLVSAEQARETLLAAYRLLLSRPEAEVAHALFTHWLHAHAARELLDLRDAGVRVAWLKQRQNRRESDIAAENQAARQWVVRLLRDVPAGHWWSFNSLVEFVWRFQPDFLRGRQQTFLRPEWWLERLPDGQPLAPDVRAEWRQAEGRYLALLLRRTLHWLGVVDLALDAQGRLKGFRITSLGALLGAQEKLREEQQPSAPVSAALLPAAPELEEDGTLLVALGDLQGDQLETLLWWCEPAGATDAALRFRPSAERVAAALDARQDLTGWLSWLEQMPQSAALAALLERQRGWSAAYGQVRLCESATLLEVDDPALLHELEMTLDLAARFVDHALGSGLVMLRAGAAEALVEELRRRGYAPWVTTYETADGP